MKPFSEVVFGEAAKQEPYVAPYTSKPPAQELITAN